MSGWEAVSGDRPRRALRNAGMIGPYFVVRLDAGSPGMTAGDFFDPSHLGDLIGDVARRLGAAEPRVAASSLQYELAERLWAVALGSWVTDRLIPDLTAVRYGRSPTGRIRLHLPNPTAHERRTATPTETAAVVSRVVIDQLASPHPALRAVTDVADGLLWGNAAAALAIVTNTLLRRGENHHHGVAEVSRALLQVSPLAGRLEGDVIGSITRRTCCLYYRTAARRTCGDCPLTGAAVVESRA